VLVAMAEQTLLDAAVLDVHDLIMPDTHCGTNAVQAER
jgi:hypothetical protein